MEDKALEDWCLSGHVIGMPSKRWCEVGRLLFRAFSLRSMSTWGSYSRRTIWCTLLFDRWWTRSELLWLSFPQPLHWLHLLYSWRSSHPSGTCSMILYSPSLLSIDAPTPTLLSPTQVMMPPSSNDFIMRIFDFYEDVIHVLFHHEDILYIMFSIWDLVCRCFDIECFKILIFRYCLFVFIISFQGVLIYFINYIKKNYLPTD